MTDSAHNPFDRDGICPFCEKMTNSLAGNPGKWPITLALPDGSGKALRFHRECVMERLFHRMPEHDEQLAQWREEGKIR